MKYLQSKLEQAIACIADDKDVDISFKLNRISVNLAQQLANQHKNTLWS